DLDVAMPATAPSTVRVFPTWTSLLGAGNTDVSPITNCFLGSSEFGPIFIPRQRPSDNDLVRGALPLDNTNLYEPVEIDHDGGGLKAFDFAANVFKAIHFKQ